MKLIIAGTRTLTIDAEFIDSCKRLLEIPMLNEVVSGGCRGVDICGEAWAELREVSLKKFPADWEKHGRAAGPIRNIQMSEYADALLLIWDGQSRGSAGMKQEMLKHGKPIYEVILRKA